MECPVNVYTDVGKIASHSVPERVLEETGFRKKPKIIGPSQALVDSPEPLQGTPSSNAKLLSARCENLSQLREAMSSFQGCSLKETAVNLVFGTGDPLADLMFVGEAPGADEDREGEPFIGASGRLLDQMISAIGLRRGDVYITNVVPWRPLGNRKPSSDECLTCLPFIQRQIALIKPRVLVFLGGTAANALVGTREGITRLRGRWLLYQDSEDTSGRQGIPAMPTFHPAYLLRQSSLKRESWHDFLSVRERLRAEQL